MATYQSLYDIISKASSQEAKNLIKGTNIPLSAASVGFGQGGETEYWYDGRKVEQDYSRIPYTDYAPNASYGPTTVDPNFTQDVKMRFLQENFGPLIDMMQQTPDGVPGTTEGAGDIPWAVWNKPSRDVWEVLNAPNAQYLDSYFKNVAGYRANENEPNFMDKYVQPVAGAGLAVLGGMAGGSVLGALGGGGAAGGGALAGEAVGAAAQEAAAGSMLTEGALGNSLLANVGQAVDAVKSFVTENVFDPVSKFLNFDASAVESANKVAETVSSGGLSGEAVGAAAQEAAASNMLTSATAGASNATPGLIDKILKWSKDNPAIASGIGSLTANVVGGALKGRGDLAKIEKERQEKEKLAEFQRSMTQSGSFFSATPRLSRGSGAAMRTGGAPLWTNGILNRRMS